jgi:hypothetical protein
MANIERQLFLPKPGTETFFLWGATWSGQSTLLRQIYPEVPWIDLLKADVLRRYADCPAAISYGCSGGQPRLGETGCRRQPTDLTVGACRSNGFGAHRPLLHHLWELLGLHHPCGRVFPEGEQPVRRGRSPRAVRRPSYSPTTPAPRGFRGSSFRQRTYYSRSWLAPAFRRRGGVAADDCKALLTSIINRFTFFP